MPQVGAKVNVNPGGSSGTQGALTGDVTAPAGSGSRATTLVNTTNVATIVGKVWGASQIFNVLEYGAKGDGSTDDTIAIQNTINAAHTAGGGTVVFPFGASGVYLVSTHIIYYAYLSYVGWGYAQGSLPTLRHKSGSNIGGGSLDGIFVSSVWATNGTTTDNPMEMYNLAFDANFANNATSQCVCVITMNWQSHFEGNQFFNGCSHNFVMTDTTTGGTQITGSGPQTSFKRNYLSTANNDLFHQTSAGTAWGTDGVMTGNFFNTTGTDGSGCWFDLAAGWEIGGNHYYGIGGVAIYANGSIGTRIHDNYIESFGNTGHTTGPYAGYYSGINATCYNGYSVEIHNNIIGCNEPAGGSRYDFVNVSNKTGQETATCSITDNVLFSYNITTKGNGIWAAADSAGGLSLIIDGNAIPNVHTPIGYVNNCTILPATVGVGIGNSSNASSTPGTYASIPPTSAAIQTALGNLVLGTAYHNTLTYDVWLTIYLGITANTSGVVKDGVGTTTTPTQTTIITGSTLTGIVPIRAKIPAGQYRLLSLSGTVTDAIVGQYLEAV